MRDMNTHTYRVIIEPDGKQFHAYAPALPGCHTFGKTLAEAKKRIRQAIAGYLETLIKERQFVPKDEGMEIFESFKMVSNKIYA